MTTFLVVAAVSGWAMAFIFWHAANKSIAQTDDAIDLIRTQQDRKNKR